MTYSYYLFISLFLIVLKTTAVPHFSSTGVFYDLLIPFLLYLGIYRPVLESMVVIFLLGFVIDNLSGGPFGLFTTFYFWLYVGTKWVLTFLHVANKFFLPLCAGISVFAQNLFVLGVLSLGEEDFQLSTEVLKTVFTEVLWALLTGVFMVMIIKIGHARWLIWLGIVFSHDERKEGE